MSLMSDRMVRAVTRALADLQPDLHYTAGDITHHAEQHGKAARRWLKSKRTTMILARLAAEGHVTMHPRGTLDEDGQQTTQRTFTVVSA